MPLAATGLQRKPFGGLHTKTLLAALAAGFVGSSHAAIVVTGGDFESPDIVAKSQPSGIPNWFDSTVTYSDWHNGEGYSSNGSQSVFLYNYNNIRGYMYQSLGTLDAGTTSLNWSFDQISYNLNSDSGNGTGDVRFFYGAGVDAGENVDIDTLGLTKIGPTINIPILPGSTLGGASGGTDTTRFGSVDVSSVIAGSTIWMDFTQTDRYFIIDNVSVTAIPEPSAALLGGIGALVLLRRRR